LRSACHCVGVQGRRLGRAAAVVVVQSPSVWVVAEMSFSSFHPHGCHFVFADGHVQFVNENIGPKTLAAMTTRAAGDVVPGSDR
jgi:prepilin-type processing-associated H-X9-DG protein